MSLLIKDGPGKLPVAVMRHYFELVVKNTSTVQKYAPLVAELDGDGNFKRYQDATADAIWIGFALGLRMWERYLMAGQIVGDDAGGPPEEGTTAKNAENTKEGR